MTRRSPRRALLGAAALLPALLLAGCGDDADAATPHLTVSEAVLPLPATPDLAAVHLVVRNDGPRDDALVAATTPGATVTLHATHIDHTGMASMTEHDAIPLPAGAETRLEPGGDHLMVEGLEPLVAGDTFPLELRFRHADPVTVDVAVTPIGALG